MKHNKKQCLFLVISVFVLVTDQLYASLSLWKKPIVAMAAMSTAVIAGYQYNELRPQVKFPEIEEAFKDVKIAPNFNIPLIDHHCGWLLKEEMTNFFTKIKEFALEDKSLEGVSMHHVDKAVTYIVMDRMNRITARNVLVCKDDQSVNDYLTANQTVLERKLELNPQLKKYNAYHEASHCLVRILKPVDSIITQLSLVPQGMYGGINIVVPSCKRAVKHSVKYASCVHNQKILNTKHSIMCDLAGGIGEEILNGEKLSFEEFITSPKYKTIGSVGLVGTDIHNAAMEAKYYCMYKDFILVSNYQEELVLSEYSNSKDLHEEIYTLLEECYEEAYKLLSENKDVLDKVVALTLEQGITSGEEIYTLVGKTRPKFDFEMTGVERAQKEVVDLINWTSNRMAFYELNHSQV